MSFPAAVDAFTPKSYTLGKTNEVHQNASPVQSGDETGILGGRQNSDLALRVGHHSAASSKFRPKESFSAQQKGGQRGTNPGKSLPFI